MKRFLAALAACSLLFAAGCASAEEPPASAGPSADGAAAQAESAPYEDGEWTVFSCGGMEVPVPTKYLDLLILQTEFTPTDDPANSAALMSFTEKKSVEDYRQSDWYQGNDDGMGWLFTVCAETQISLEQNLQFDWGGWRLFGRAADGTYYAVISPTDVRAYRTGDVLGEDAEKWDEWEMLNAMADDVTAEMIRRNGLTPCNQKSFYEGDYLYEGSHASVRYDPYLHSDTRPDDGVDYREILLMSQPCRQGEGGIWCVEQVIEPYGSHRIFTPSMTESAADYYQALQDAADAGEHTECLTPLGGALYFIRNSWLYDDAAMDELELLPADEN